MRALLCSGRGHVLDHMHHDLAWAIDKPLGLGPLEDALAGRGVRTVTLTAGRAAPQPRAGRRSAC